MDVLDDYGELAEGNGSNRPLEHRNCHYQTTAALNREYVAGKCLQR
jgi:hypothetical protein